MRGLVVVSLLLCLAALPAVAGDIEIVPQKIEVNGLLGTMGAAGGIFWPAIQVPEYDISLGPMVAVGNTAAVFGAGVNVPIVLSIPIFENINFGWIAYGWDWETDDWGLEGGVGITVAIN